MSGNNYLKKIMEGDEDDQPGMTSSKRISFEGTPLKQPLKVQKALSEQVHGQKQSIGINAKAYLNPPQVINK